MRATPQDATKPGRIQYAVTWDADPQLADNNQGTSILHVTALDATTGHQLWQKVPTTVSSMYQSSIQQMVDGVIYIASSTTQSTLILAVDAKDGHTLWQREEKQSGIQSMNICAGHVYLRVGNANLEALQATNGQVLWTYTSQYVYLSPSFVVTANAVYIIEPEMSRDIQNSKRQFVTALGASDGKVLWSKAYQNAGDANALTLVATSQAVYAINQIPATSKLQALQPETGKEIWTTQMPGNARPFHVLALGDTLYLNGANKIYNPKIPSSQNNRMLLIALNTRDGKQLWQRQHDYDWIRALPGQDLYGYKGYREGGYTENGLSKKTLCALDRATGKDRWCLDTLQPSLFSLSASQDAILVVETIQDNQLTLSQNLYALSKQDGKILWKLPWKSSSSSVDTLTLVTVTEGQSYNSVS